MNEWSNEAGCWYFWCWWLGFIGSYIRSGWWSQNLICSLHGPIDQGPKYWAERWGGWLPPHLRRLQQMITNRYGLSHKAGLARGGARHGMMENTLYKERGILSFNPSLLMTGCVISCTSHTSLDLNFQIRKMPIRNVRLIQWFSNSSLPRIYLWNFSYLPSCCENVWLSNKKNHKKIVSQSSITTSKVHWQHDVTDDKH